MSGHQVLELVNRLVDRLGGRIKGLRPVPGGAERIVQGFAAHLGQQRVKLGFRRQVLDRVQRRLHVGVQRRRRTRRRHVPPLQEAQRLLSGRGIQRRQHFGPHLRRLGLLGLGRQLLGGSLERRRVQRMRSRRCFAADQASCAGRRPATVWPERNSTGRLPWTAAARPARGRIGRGSFRLRPAPPAALPPPPSPPGWRPAFCPNSLAAHRPSVGPVFQPS